MKLSLAALALVALAIPARAADVGVSISVSQPGVYGRIDIGRFPQPVLVMPQPVVVAAPTVVVQREPVYLWVPADHRRHWKKHCKRYDACGVPVYFVQDRWYRDHVMHDRRGDRPGRPDKADKPGRGHGRDKHDG